MAEVLLLEGLHSPRPASPLFASLLLQGLEAGGRAAAQQRGGDPDAMGMRIEHGHIYVAFRKPRWPEPRGEPAQMLEMLQGFPRRWTEQMLPAIQAEHERIRGLFAEGASPEQAVKDLATLRAAWETVWTIHFQCTGIVAGWFALEGMLSQAGIPEARSIVSRLLSTEGSDLEVLDARLHELGAAVAADPALAPLLEERPAEALVDKLRGHPTLGAQFERVWSEVHERSVGFDVYEPTWGEDPAPFKRAVLTGARNVDLLTQREETRARLAKERQRLAAETEARLPPPMRPAFRAALSATQDIWHLHETHHLHIDDRSMGVVRQALVRAGERLHARGLLKDPVEVVFLHADELEKALGSGVLDASVIERRRGEREAAMRSTPPQIIGEPSADFYNEPFVALLMGLRPDEPVPAGATPVLSGVAVSPGKVRGRARVVESPDALGDLEAGEVLVAKATSPTWTVQMGRAAAYVTLHGGMLSHTAVVARELGLPAVTAVAGLLDRVRTGDLVEVDGDAGTITVIPERQGD